MVGQGMVSSFVLLGILFAVLVSESRSKEAVADAAIVAELFIDHRRHVSRP
jgi:hypothetical protein